MENEYRERWGRATEAQRRKLYEALNEQLGRLSSDVRAAIQSGLNLQQLNAQVVRQVVMSGSTVSAATLTNAAGFSAYIALSSIVHFVFTTVLGIRLPFAVYTFLSSALAATLGWAAPLTLVLAATKYFSLRGQMNADLLEAVAATGIISHPEFIVRNTASENGGDRWECLRAELSK